MLSENLDNHKLKTDSGNAYNPTAAIIIIGDEVLSGRTLDGNSNYLAKKLNQIGIFLKEIRVIADDSEMIISTVNLLRKKYNYIFTTGGIGPTHDDITAENIAAAFEVKLELNEEALNRLKKHYSFLGQELNDARKKMAYIPGGAKLIDNPVSAAPGFYLENVFVMAGVPKIMQAMFDYIEPLLTAGKPLQSKTIETFITEGHLAAGLTEIQAITNNVKIGSYPFMQQGKLGTALVMRSHSTEEIELISKKIEDFIKLLENKYNQS